MSDYRRTGSGSAPRTVRGNAARTGGNAPFEKRRSAEYAAGASRRAPASGSVRPVKERAYSAPASARPASGSARAASRSAYSAPRSVRPAPKAAPSVPKRTSAPYRKSANRFYARRFKKKPEWRRYAVAVALLVIFLYGAVNLASYGVRSIQTRRTNQELAELYESSGENTYVLAAGEDPAVSEESEQAEEAAAEAPVQEEEPALLDEYQYFGNSILPRMVSIKEKNSDVVAWLRIPGVVNLPVVYRDNSHYLTHDFNGKKNKSGTLFLDEAHMFASDTQYMVVHGHNMTDGTMFGLLSHYHRQDYVQKHPMIYFSTLFREEQYKIVGVLVTPSTPEHAEYVPFTGMRKFYSVDQFNSFIDSLYSNAIYWDNQEKILPSDAILALSTCYGDDDRIVIVAKRVSVQTQNAEANSI